MGPDSKPRRVLGVTSGIGPLYRVVPVKGEPYVVNDKHVLSFKKTGTEKVVNLEVMEYLRLLWEKPASAERLKGWRAAVDWEQRPVPIPSYILGIWLGDGDSRNPRITNPEPEIEKALKAYAKSVGLIVNEYNYGYNGKAKTMAIVTKAGRGGADFNPFLSALRELNLINNKHIPRQYLINSREERLNLLAGLIDTDGYLNNGNYEIAVKHPSLAEDIQFLCRSLGYAVNLTVKQITVNGVKRQYFRIYISGETHKIPVRVSRKKASTRRQTKDVLKTGITVEPLGIGRYYGFELDGDHLFLLGDFTVTHNSHFAKALGNEVGWPVLSLDMGRVFGSLVGESEARMREALKVVDAMAPVVLFID